MMNIELSIYFPNVFILIFILKMFILSPFLVSSTFHQLSFVHFNKSNNTHTNQLYYFEVDETKKGDKMNIFKMKIKIKTFGK